MDDTPDLTDSAGTPLPSSLEGHFLVSETELTDPNFTHTVVLMINHNEEGAFGLIVNRQTDIVLSDFVEEFEDLHAGSVSAFVGI